MADIDSQSIQLRLEIHYIDTVTVFFSGCDIRRHKAQRELDTDHVDNLYEEFQNEINRSESLLAIYYGDRAALPAKGNPAHDLPISIISGQHRLAALMKMNDDSQKWWSVVLYDPCSSAYCSTKPVLTLFFILFCF
jgi:hypothetical protein